MGFSIGRFLGAIAAPVGLAIGGVIPTILGAGVSAALTRPAALPGRQLIPTAAQPGQFPLTSVVPTPTGPTQIVQINGQRGFGTEGFGVQRRRVGLTGLVSRGIGGAFGAVTIGALVITDILQRAREASGQRVTKNKIIDSAKHCGIELTAETFGISESDVCKVIVAGRSRRRRGVSAADVRRTKRTLRFVRSIRKDFKAVRL